MKEAVLTQRHDSGWDLRYPSMAAGSRPVRSTQVRRHGRCHQNTKLLCPFHNPPPPHQSSSRLNWGTSLCVREGFC